MASAILWFRRDLRLADNPALGAAAEESPGAVVPLYVVDPVEWDVLGVPQRFYLTQSLKALGGRIGGLLVLRGDPRDVVPRLAARLGNATVHGAADATPYGRARDDIVAARASFIRTGSGYAVTPGGIVKSDGTPYRVFTPFHRVWLDHGWRDPAVSVDVNWDLPTGGETLPEVELPSRLSLPQAGELFAHERWRDYRENDLPDYADVRDLPGVDRTSGMSVHLAFGEIHPRTLLADLGPDDDAFRRELAFREFYADVLFHHPESANGYYKKSFEAMRYNEPGADFESWQRGHTGFPIVDAGMRQLLAEGRMHNRVRMIAASFLVKDLHVEWQHGAHHFFTHLVDADLASNQHGWQWVAGCGTDAAPYFRIFNPIAQGRKLDADGGYIRRYVPELAGLNAKDIHEPWLLPLPPEGYPPPLVDHAEERLESLSRYREIRTGIR